VATTVHYEFMLSYLTFICSQPVFLLQFFCNLH